MTHDTSIAVLIDADNSPASKIEEVLGELAKYGVINIRRAYGNWKSPHLKGWEAVLHEYAIQPIQQFDYSKGKNATDAAMIIDAMDLLYTKHLEGVALVSSDADFTPLVMRLRANGLKVFGFGEEKTPMPFVNACSHFLYLENMGCPELSTNDAGPVPAARPAPARKTANELKGDTRLVSLLRNSVLAAADDEGWAHMGAVGQHISKQASFDARNYGYAKLRDLFSATGLFDLQTRDKGLYVRDRRQATPAGGAVA
ncbi:MAG: NYN domain-containing protein [Gallionellaceae bacterium]|nr:NYN domain-containing protein [Gallionellaceae bacterium]